MIFWISLFVFTLFMRKNGEFKLNFDNTPVLILWFVSLYTIISRALGVNTPIGALKNRKKFFVQNEESLLTPSEIKSEINFQNKGALKVFIVWCVFLATEWLAIKYKIVDEKLIILGVCILRAAEKFFIITKCPFGMIMKNTCCTKCRIYGWDQLMLNSPLIFYPSIISFSLILPAIILFIGWEFSSIIHPERFSTKNYSIDCSNCDQYCGRCTNKNGELWFYYRALLLLHKFFVFIIIYNTNKQNNAYKYDCWKHIYFY